MLRIEADGALVSGEGINKERYPLPRHIADELRDYLPKDNAQRAAELIMQKYHELNCIFPEARTKDIARFIRQVYEFE